MDKKQELALLRAELAERELAIRRFSYYLPYVHGKAWKKTKMSDFLAARVQDFVEEDTGHAYDILVIETPPQHGKECADSTPVPTPTGWKRHGDLQVGDYVFGRNGEPVKVRALIPQEEPSDYLVTFSDGERIKVHGAHEWVVHDRTPSRRGRSITLETRVMARTSLKDGAKHYRYSVDHGMCVAYPSAKQPIKPYAFGLWLGDGSTTKPVISHSPDDTEPIKRCVELGYAVSAEWAHDKTGVITTSFARTELVAGLRELGLGYRGCRAKYVPACYRVADVDQRLALLAGVIDSDGYVYQRNGRVTISNTNTEIIEGLAEVCRSLGFHTTVSMTAPKLSSSGIQGKQTVYQLTFNPDRPIPTALPRKSVDVTTAVRRRRAIVGIELCEPEHGMCITVDGGVYLVGEHFTPTHNSLTITESFPSWYLGKHPDHRIILASYNDDFAERFCRKNKEKVKQYGNTLFHINLAVERAEELELDNGVGRLISRGIRSGITGNPANLVIIDDPIKNREEADSPTYRAKIWEEWQNSIKTRLAAGAKVIVIMTPWHEDDLGARILQNEHNATLLRLPVEAEENDPLGRRRGAALAPELGKDDAWLADFKPSYISDPLGGARAWSALYQCNPRVEGGNLVQREWWRYYDPRLAPAFGTELISVDAAFKGTTESDFVAITVWGKVDNDFYLRYCLNRQMTFTETLQALRLVQKLYPRAQRVLIEDKANGSAIIDVLQREMFCIPVNPRGGKEARVNAVSPAIESGHVYIPTGEPWVEEYVNQFTVFPAGAHDDMVDSSTQALSFMLFSSGYVPKPEPDDVVERRSRKSQAEHTFLSGEMYDIYGAEDRWTG